MGKAVTASMNGLAFDRVCYRCQASVRLTINKRSEVMAASLNESRNGSNSIVFNNSIIQYLTY